MQGLQHLALLTEANSVSLHLNNGSHAGSFKHRCRYPCNPSQHLLFPNGVPYMQLTEHWLLTIVFLSSCLCEKRVQTPI